MTPLQETFPPKGPPKALRHLPSYFIVVAPFFDETVSLRLFSAVTIRKVKREALHLSNSADRLNFLRPSTVVLEVFDAATFLSGR